MNSGSYTYAGVGGAMETVVRTSIVAFHSDFCCLMILSVLVKFFESFWIQRHGILAKTFYPAHVRLRFVLV